MSQLPGHRIHKSDRSHRVDGPVVLLIGSREMSVQCADMLVAQGFDIAGLQSPDAPLRNWAIANRHPFFDDLTTFQEWAETISYDYLLSVLNFSILPTSLIESPQICAINYHDAPLPKYAGSHACAWALKNGETTHGVSWHIMTSEVDAGDILKQVTFPIAADETIERMHQKCYLCAMRAFRSLLPTLKDETFTRTPQDLSQRTYYARASKPATISAPRSSVL